MADDMSHFHSRSPSPTSPGFHYARTGGQGAADGDSGSGGSGGSGVDCLQLRSPPGPFHYLISEQAKSFVALQELQNEVGALLEFRDLVIETFPNLRSKMSPAPAPSRQHSGAGGDWEPGVRVRRKLNAAGADNTARTKPQPSVQDSGFSTETSCKSSGAGGGGSTAGASGPARLEDELWALLDVIQRKGSRLRDDAELLRSEMDPAPAADEWFARALASAAAPAPCVECRLRREREALLDAVPPVATPRTPRTPLGRLDRVLATTPARPPQVRTPDPNKFAAILKESDPVELQRHLLVSTVHAQALEERATRSATQRSDLLERLRRERELNDDLRFQLEEKTIELEGARAQLRLTEARGPGGGGGGGGARGSMRDMQPLDLDNHTLSNSQTNTTDTDKSHPGITDTPKRSRRSRIPLPGHKARAPAAPSTPAASYRSRSGESQSWRASLAARSPAPRSRTPAAPPPAPGAANKKLSSVPVRRASGVPHVPHAREDAKVRSKSIWNMIFSFKEANSS